MEITLYEDYAPWGCQMCNWILLWTHTSSQKMLEQIKIYNEKLFADPTPIMVVEEVIHVQQEKIYDDLKRKDVLETKDCCKNSTESSANKLHILAKPWIVSTWSYG